eukprot:comp14984_c0_seq1/m.11588 comp14984_c0_seq1/g.11588  ORF comp14984_c0_seq1/g.11588 comp14984_c0_seq1/m.11588 type:complete len:312 (-) comp14984_c0_seq1:364-1299(-)
MATARGALERYGSTALAAPPRERSLSVEKRGKSALELRLAGFDNPESECGPERMIREETMSSTSQRSNPPLSPRMKPVSPVMGRNRARSRSPSPYADRRDRRSRSRSPEPPSPRVGLQRFSTLDSSDTAMNDIKDMKVWPPADSSPVVRTLTRPHRLRSENTVVERVRGLERGRELSRSCPSLPGVVWKEPEGDSRATAQWLDSGRILQLVLARKFLEHTALPPSPLMQSSTNPNNQSDDIGWGAAATASVVGTPDLGGGGVMMDTGEETDEGSVRGEGDMTAKMLSNLAEIDAEEILRGVTMDPELMDLF